MIEKLCFRHDAFSNSGRDSHLQALLGQIGGFNFCKELTFLSLRCLWEQLHIARLVHLQVRALIGESSTGPVTMCNQQNQEVKGTGIWPQFKGHRPSADLDIVGSAQNGY